MAGVIYIADELQMLHLERNLFMTSTYFAKWKSFIRAFAAVMVMIFMISAVNPTAVQAEETTTYTHDVEGWFQVCEKVGKDLVDYGFSYGNRNMSTLSASIKKGRKSNCASYVSWCLQEFGILNKGETFYTKRGRIIKKFKSWHGKVKIIRMNKRVDKAKLKPGDIVGWGDMIHTNIYAGKNANGEKLWYDGGSAAADTGRVRWYESPHKKRTYKYLNKHRIAVVIRIKGL
mgnify:CR=1 FL=1